MPNLIDIKYSKQELASYANSSDTCVTLVRKTRDVLLYPVQLSDLSAGVRQNLDALLLKYDFMFNSIILGYNRIKILSKCGLICHANARIKVQIEADFYLFNPAVGSKLKGVVCKRSGHHLGCLVHKAFNAYIPTKDESHMSGLYYFIGQDLTFTVVDLDLTSGRLPYLRGQLDDGNTERNDGDGSVNQVGPDNGTSFSHEEDAGGWDSGIALSSPGKNTIVNEELESEDKYYGMKRESRLTSKAIQLAARNTKNKLTNKMKNSPKTERSIDSLSNMAKVLDKYYSSQDYGISDDESQQLVQETVGGSESFSTDNSSTDKEKSKSKSKKNKTPLKTKKCLKETPCNPENSIIEEPETSSNHVKSDGKTGNTAKEIIGMVDMDSKATSTPPRKKRKSISKKNCSSPGNDDMIKQLLKSMERSFTEEETDVSEKKVLENTAILPSPVKVVEEREEIGNDGGSKPRIQESKGDNEVSFKSPSSTTKRRKSTSKVKNISIPENKYLESGGSLTDLNKSIKDEDSKLRPESQKILGESGSSSVDSVLAVKKKRKSNSTDNSPLKSEKCAIESLGDAKNFIREGPKTSPLVQSDGKTVQRSIDMATNVTPSSVKKKGKSTSKKNISSPSSDDLIKHLLKSMERSFAEEETDVSEKEDLKNSAIIPPPVKVVADSEGMGNEDKYKIRTQEGSEDGGISIKNPSSTCKKRKSISKVKKVGSPEKEDVIKKLVKDIEMPIVETEITKDKSLETNDKEETTLGAIAKVTGRKENARKSIGSLKEKDKLLVIRKELVTASDSEKMPDNPVENYVEQIEKHILSKSEAISEIKSTLDAVQLSVKKKKRKSTSNGSTVSSNTTGEEKAVTLSSEVIEESEVKKLIAKNKKLLGNEHGSEGGSGLKDEIPSLKDSKAMKRKRESKDLTESPQRKKVAKSHLDTPKVSDILRPGSNSIDSS